MIISFTTKTRRLATAAILLLSAIPARPQAPKPRITGAIDNASRTTLVGSRPPRAIPANDAGAIAPSTRLQGITLVFNHSAAQQADLESLIAAQQNPASPSFHQWLTPEQFGARFGMPDSDIASTLVWLQQQGFTLESVSRSRDRISFAGTAAQVAAAFGAELHTFTSPEGSHFAPAADLTLPTALAPVVLAVTNLSSFHPHSHLIASTMPQQPKTNFTSATSGNHFLTPLDVATIYDINTAYNSGYTGTGQSLAVIGQSAVVTTDITTFQSAIGLTPNAPNMVLLPNTGTSAISSGDEAESDLDLEYSSSIAKGATIYFVYTGNSTNYNAFDALTYAVQNRIAPIISSSYGDCEISLGATNYNTLNGTLAQAATQGQTVISAAGDSGSTDCYGTTSLSKANQQALSADFPASSPYVTGLGGTEFPYADTVSGANTYFLAANGTDVIGSAISYIPEMAWNDDSSSNGISSGGGGVSIFAPRPTWQTGVSGVPTGFYRLVPDIALDSSPADAPYAFCTSDSTFWATSQGQTSSCTNGLRDTSTGDLTVAGGTSFAAPIFAGMLAIINQSLKSTGQGVVNPILYTLASNATTYASAFHDIVSGSNACAAGSAYCSGLALTDYTTTIGYDQATGLGSVDFDKLLIAWPSATATSTRGKFTVAATSLSVASASTGTSTVTVTPTGGYTGTIAWSLTASPVLANACYSLANAVITGASAVTETLTVAATSTGCPGAAARPGFTNFASGTAPIKPFAPATEGIFTASLLFAAIFIRRSRRFRAALAICLFSIAGFTLTGCSNQSIASPAAPAAAGVNATAGTYTVTITGVDTVTNTITASTTFTLTVH